MRWQIALALLPFIATGAHAADIKGTSKIEGVTVYPQGAEVTRIGKVKMERGEHVILFNDLPTNAVTNSIRVEGKATGRLEIGSVDTRRVKVPSTDEAVAATERKRIEDAIEKLRDDRAQLSATVEAAETQKTLINNLTQLPTKSAPANGGAVVQPDWAQLYAMIGQRIAEAQKTILDTQVKIREVDLQIRDLEGKLAQAAPTQQERTEVKVFVNAGGALDADLVIRYQVTSASWTPFYDARLATGTKAQAPQLQLVRRASIQQRTGEIWDNVALSLSTARPGAGTAAPQLGTMTVDYEGDLPVARPRSEIAPTAMMRSVGQGRTASASDDEDGRRDRAVAQTAEEVRANEVRATVDTQGFQAVYGIPGRATVPATGEMKRVQIDDMALDPALTVRTVPKRDEKAYLYAKLTIARGTPILPGPVSLFRDATFVGSSRLPLLAPGEEHELGFGVDDAVKVRHAIAEEKRSESGIITSSKTDTRNFRMTIKNLRERPINLVVLDQVPVSQNADIKVELTGKTAPTKQNLEDKRGVVSWEMKLEPDEEKVIEHGYRVTWPSAKKVIYGN
jgi:uncharacterized protein (TIGR02231 family)